VPNYGKIRFLLQKALIEEDNVPGGRYYQNLRNDLNPFDFEQVPQSFEILPYEVVATVNESKVNPMNTKANLD
jgi:hypothetical protein